MTIITVHLQARMATGIETIYSLSTMVKKNTEAARCKLLMSAYDCGARQGINVNACTHRFA